MTPVWWGEFEVEEGQTRFWQVGPCRLWMTRLAEEWQLAMESSDDGLSRPVVAAAPPSESFGADARTVRFGFRESPEAIRLEPATADRPVIVRASAPFFVPAGEEVSLFVSTPLWLRVSVESSDVLFEAPLLRPSDTWFGPSTREGELCYASRTAARFSLENVPRRAHRALSVVHIRNRAPSQLTLERLKLPVPFLSVYGGETGQLWTEAVTLEREEEDENASIRLGRGAPPEAGTVERVAGPRHEAERGLLTRTFGGLLGLMGEVARIGD